MKKLGLALLFLLANFSWCYADNKPPHYGDWDVIYDKVLKKTTLIHQHRPYGQGVPGMGDAFSAQSLQLQYSLEAVISGTPGTPSLKVVYYWLFDNILNVNATFALANPTRFFKYSPNSQFTLLIDDNSTTIPTQNYHTGEFGDDISGHFPFEELQAPLTQDTLNQLVNAKEVAGNLSSDDQNAGKSFTFDDTFKQIVKAFVYRVNEITAVPVAPPAH